jgi:two-component system chemotaxis response regulator CheY
MCRVLVIDDTDSVRNVLRLLLEGGGHAVRLAGGGAEGLRLFLEGPADVVFCDLYMPAPDGFRTIRELRRASAGVWIVAVTAAGLSGGDPRPAALEAGADRALLKPFAVSDLLALAAGRPLPPAALFSRPAPAR